MCTTKIAKAAREFFLFFFDGVFDPHLKLSLPLTDWIQKLLELPIVKYRPVFVAWAGFFGHALLWKSDGIVKEALLICKIAFVQAIYAEELQSRSVSLLATIAVISSCKTLNYNSVQKIFFVEFLCSWGAELEPCRVLIRHYSPPQLSIAILYCCCAWRVVCFLPRSKSFPPFK